MSNEKKEAVWFHELFPKKYLEAAELGGVPRTVTIDHVENILFEGKEKADGLLFFRGSKRQMVLNKTNQQCLRAMFGDYLPDWQGKRITLIPAKTNVGPKKDVPCIRISGSPDINREFRVEVKNQKPITLKKTADPRDKKPSPSEATPPTHQDPAEPATEQPAEPSTAQDGGEDGRDQ